MINKPTLLILAAGMGSRYGGLKQLDQFGPNGEAIIHYSIYDAIQAGFGKFVFVIRQEIEEQFKAWIDSTLPQNLDYHLVYQEVDSAIPTAYVHKTKDRIKPWGTGHAILVAQDVVSENFAVINGDDYYGQESFRIMADHLKALQQDNRYAMVGYELRKTLSENGAVSRGICTVDTHNRLIDVEEHTAIERHKDILLDTDRTPHKPLDEEAIVSLNFWGFTPSIFTYLAEKFTLFMDAYKGEPKKEFFIPFVVDELIKAQQVSVDVLSTPNSWFGVTYTEDKAFAVQQIQHMISNNQYPNKLF